MSRQLIREQVELDLCCQLLRMHTPRPAERLGQCVNRLLDDTEVSTCIWHNAATPLSVVCVTSAPPTTACRVPVGTSWCLHIRLYFMIAIYLSDNQICCYHSISCCRYPVGVRVSCLHTCDHHPNGIAIITILQISSRPHNVCIIDVIIMHTLPAPYSTWCSL